MHIHSADHFLSNKKKEKRDSRFSSEREIDVEITICAPGLHGKILVSGGATGVASMRSCQKLLLCPMEPMPNGSKMDLLLPKAKPISGGGNTSGIM